MKYAKILLMAIIISNLLPLSMHSAMAQPIIYGAANTVEKGPSTFYTIDASTGAATSVGPIGFNRCSGMDFDASGTLFATCQRSDVTNLPVLVTINPATGAGTEVGPTGLPGQVSDISFRNSDGILFAFDATPAAHKLNTINTATGLGTLVGLTGLSFDGGNGIAFDATDILHHIGRDAGAHTLNQATGLASSGVPLTYPFDGGSVKSMDYDPSTGTLYGIAHTQGAGPGGEFLVTIDLTSATVDVIDFTAAGMDAIAVFSPIVVVDNPVGGEILPVDMTALFVAGVFGNTILMFPIIGGIAGTAIYFVKTRRQNIE